MKDIHVHSPAKRILLRASIPVLETFCRLFSHARALDSSSSPRRILVFRPDHIGDAIMATAVLAPLRNRFPDAHLAMCVGPWAAPLFEEHPLIDELIVASLPWWANIRKSPGLEGGFSCGGLFRKLRAQPFDLFIDLRSDIRHLLLFGVLGKAKHILAYDRTGGAGAISAHVAYRPEDHEVLKNVRLLEPLGIKVDQPSLNLPVQSAAIASVVGKLRERGVDSTASMVILCPQTRLKVKEWPHERWVELASEIRREFLQTKIIVVGDRVLNVPAENGVCVLPGLLTLPELNALFSRSRLVIGSDSAPLHLAACHDVPILALFGPTRPSLFAPFGPRVHVLAGLCECNRDLHLECKFSPGDNGECMRRISVAEVFAQSARFL